MSQSFPTRSRHGALVRVLAVATAILPLLLGSCKDNRDNIVSVELVEKGESGNTERVLLVSLVRPVARSEFDPARVSIRVAPPVDLDPRVQAINGDEIRSFAIRIGAAGLEAEGVFSGDPDATSGPTGIGIDLGTGEVWRDLLPRKTHPVLQRAIWKDESRNLVVDSGDNLRLVFDRAVTVASDGAEVLVPEHLYLTVSDDRLGRTDDPARLTMSPDPREVLVELGAAPRLVPARDFAPNTRGGFQPLPDSFLEPSGLAVHGTPLHPSAEIIDARSGLGAVSRNEVGIELPENHPRFRQVGQRFPAGQPVESLSATTIFDNLVLICGGISEDQIVQGDVLLFDPLAGPGQQSIHEPQKLKVARHLHTATALPGPDGKIGTTDDFLVVVGGTDGRQSLDEIEVVRFSDTAGFEIKKAQQELAYPRYDHTATTLSGNRILITGGVNRQEDGMQLVATAEILSFEHSAEGPIEVKSAQHILPLPRTTHTATRLEFANADTNFDYVFVFGGSGIPRETFEKSDKNYRTKKTYPYDRSRILGNPEILRIPRSDTERIEITAVDVVPSYEFVRHSHRAISVEPTDDGRAQVLVSGGSLRPVLGLPGAGHWNVESFRPPQGHECATSWLFIVDEDDPDSTEVHPMASPTGETRVQHQLIEIPGLGALSLGGENSSGNGRRAPLVTGELFLTKLRTIVPFSILLERGRTGFAYVTTSNENGTSVFLFGGLGSEGHEEALADIEVLDLPAAR